MKKFGFILIMLVFGTVAKVSAQSRTEFLLEKGWKFTREDDPQFRLPSYDDGKWQSVTVPHDWAIYGPFSANDL